MSLSMCMGRKEDRERERGKLKKELEIFTFFEILCRSLSFSPFQRQRLNPSKPHQNYNIC
jgi:hypothetical protein